MHFWIQKGSAQWGRRGCGKVTAMVTPVHRFQAVEAVIARNHHAHHRYPRHALVATRPHHHNHPASHTQPPGGPDRDLDASVFLDHATHHHLACHGAAGPSLAATGRLKCGMWVSFALVTVFMAGAKFYFNTQSTGLEVLVFCALLVAVLFAGCAVSLCEAVAQPIPPPGAVVTAAPAVVMVNAVPPTSITGEVSIPPSTSIATTSEIGAEPPPPPYHIAVLLPPPPPPGPPSPPPAYDKAVTVS